jgi:hypothetical protein
MRKAGAPNHQLAPSEANANALAPRVRIEDIARPSLLDDERGNRVSLPTDHPEWRPDVLSLSNRAKALLERIKPFLIRVMTFWDHRATRMELDDLTLEIDASGSYRTI